MSDTQEQKKGYGWIPDIPDHRDYQFKVGAPVDLEKLPSKVDLREQNPIAMGFPVYDQGNLGSCTANAIGAAIRYCQIIQDGNGFAPSRLFIYYNERWAEGTITSDSGAMIRDGVKSVNDLGACSEQTWPYTIPLFTKKPPEQAYKEGLTHQALLYRRIMDNDLEDMKACLASGFPFVFGFAVYESFESQQVAKTGQVPMPQIHEQMLGGHAVLCVGYDDSTQRFIVRNSWGDKWGDKGYFYMPYDYLKDNNLADDFWVITLMEEEDIEKMENDGGL